MTIILIIFFWSTFLLFFSGTDTEVITIVNGVATTVAANVAAALEVIAVR